MLKTIQNQKNTFPSTNKEMLLKITHLLFKMFGLSKYHLLACLIVLGCLFPAYSQAQRETNNISVYLEIPVSIVKKTDSIKFYYTIQNNSAESFYLIIHSSVGNVYDQNKNELSLNLWFRSLNEEVFIFPKIKKLKPNQRIKLSGAEPIADWGDWVKPGKFSVDVGVGLLSARDVKGKKINSKHPILFYEDFMKLTQEAWSNRAQIEITN